MTTHLEGKANHGEGSSRFHTHRPTDLFSRIEDTRDRGEALMIGVRAMDPGSLSEPTIRDGLQRLRSLTSGLQTTFVAIEPEFTFMRSLESVLPDITSSSCLGDRWQDHELELLRNGIQLVFTNNGEAPLIVGPYSADPMANIAHSTIASMNHAVDVARAFSV